MIALVGLWIGFGTLFFYLWNLPDEKRKREIITATMPKEERDLHSACFWSARNTGRIKEYDPREPLEESMKKFMPHMETEQTKEIMLRCYRAAEAQGRSDFQWTMDLDEMQMRFLPEEEWELIGHWW